MDVHENRSDGALRPVGRAHSSLRDLIAVEVRSAILAGSLRPGERLVEDRLAQDFGVSRIPVREALRALAAEGLVTLVPRRGAAVAELSREAACEMIEVRATLEGLNARLAARRCDAAILPALSRLIERGDAALAAGRIDELAACNDEVHEVLAQAGNSSVLGDIMRSLRDRTRIVFRETRDHAARLWREHAAILRAVAAGDEEVAALLAARHVANAGADFLAEDPACRQDCGRGLPAERRPAICPISDKAPRRRRGAT